MVFNIESIAFTGPLDLLIQLVKTNKCDIQDIFIQDIIMQYFQIIENSQVKESDLASDFLMMASHLLQIKSKYFIYLDDNTIEDPRIELFNLLEEYQLYKQKTIFLAEAYNRTIAAYTNKTFEVITENVIDFSQITPNDLYSSYKGYLDRNDYNQHPVNLVSHKKISLQIKIEEIELVLKNMASIYFDNLVNKSVKDDVVAGLLGILELAKDQRVNLHQRDIFEDILIERENYGN